MGGLPCMPWLPGGFRTRSSDASIMAAKSAQAHPDALTANRPPSGATHRRASFTPHVRGMSCWLNPAPAGELYR
jgi:hypothetical protein